MSRRVSQGLAVVALALLCGCATGRRVRLETDRAPPRVFIPPASSEPVQVAEAEFREALSRWVLEAPLHLRPGNDASHVVPAAAGDAALVDSALRKALRLDYGRWCQRHEVPGDCLSLLQDGLDLSAGDRLTLAVGFSLDTVWDGVEVAVGEHLSATALKALVAGFLASYVLMLAAPEPFITKGVAVVLTGYLTAWLGMGPLWDLVRASRELVAASKQATTFARLEKAGHHFGRVLGENGARILILAATAGLGGRAGLLAKGPKLPGFTQAALQAEGLLRLRLVALGEVQSIAITSSGGLVIRLTSSAASISGTGSGGGGDEGDRPRVTGDALKALRQEFESVKPKFWKHEAATRAEAYSAEDLVRMRQGKAPLGGDGHPMELHHQIPLAEGGTNAFSNLRPITRTEHRLGPNYKKNHPNLP